MTPQDIQNILAFLNRCDLKGNEAVEMVRLQQLLVKIGQEAQMAELPAEEKPTE